MVTNAVNASGANTPDADGERGSALISRIPVSDDLARDVEGVTIPCRVSGAMLKSDPSITVVGIHVPSRDPSVEKTERKQRFVGSLIDAYDRLPLDLTQHVVIGGDYNVIARTHQPLHAGFLPFEFGFLDGLRARGLADAYELQVRKRRPRMPEICTCLNHSTL